MLPDHACNPLEALLVGREPRGRLVGEASDELTDRVFLLVGDVANPILDRVDKRVLTLFETFFLRLLRGPEPQMIRFGLRLARNGSTIF